jgi:hypothetical protein
MEGKFRSWLDHAADHNSPLDIKNLIHCLVIDVLGELAFSKPFGALDDLDENRLPSVNKHVYLATVTVIISREYLPSHNADWLNYDYNLCRAKHLGPFRGCANTDPTLWSHH